MKITLPSFSIEERDEARDGLAIIERAGRLCYKSEDKITENSAEMFVRGLIKRRHFSVLEPVSYTHLDVYKRQGPGATREIRGIATQGINDCH